MCVFIWLNEIMIRINSITESSRLLVVKNATMIVISYSIGNTWVYGYIQATTCTYTCTHTSMAPFRCIAWYKCGTKLFGWLSWCVAAVDKLASWSVHEQQVREGRRHWNEKHKMYKSFVETYVCVFVLIIWAAQKSDCKQGGNCVYLLNFK